MREFVGKLKWQGYGVQLGIGEADQLQNFRFVDDVLLIGKSLLEVTNMLKDVTEQVGMVGLELHMGNTNILSNGFGPDVEKREVDILGQKVVILAPDESTTHLGKELCLTNIHDKEIDSRICKGWKTFYKFKYQLCDKSIALAHRLRLFDAVVSPCVLYGSSTWTMNASRKRKLRSAQRKMTRKILGMKFKVGETEADGYLGDSEGSDDKLAKDKCADAKEATAEADRSTETNSYSSTTSTSDSGQSDEDEQEEEEHTRGLSNFVQWMKAATREVEQKMKEFKIKDWLHQQKTKKWEFAGHAARRTDERWTIKVIQMEQLQKRKQGGQNLR